MARSKVELQFKTFSDFPVIGNETILYIATDSDNIFRWNGTEYVRITDQEYKQRQLIRSGVKGDFLASGITSNTQIQITADTGGEFEVYFNTDETVDNIDGFSIQVSDQAVNVPVDAATKQFHIAVDSTGTMFTTEIKTDSSDLTKVHLISYTALNGTAISESIIANPYVSYSDKTYQGTLNANGIRTSNIQIISQDNATLGIQSSAFNVLGNAVDYENDKVSLHEKGISAKNPLNWTYLFTGSTIPPSTGTDVVLDPTKFDNNGTLTTMPAGSANTSVQLVLVSSNGEFVIVFGQEVFTSFDDALLNARNIDFDLPGVVFEQSEVARIVIGRDATDSADTTEVRIIDTSTSGEGGGSGQPPATGVFFDADFKLKNSTDDTKTAQFDASNVPTGTNNVYDLPTAPGELVVDLPTHSVIELNDVTDAGSGEIITDTERTQIGTNTSDITDKEDFTGGGQPNIGAAGINVIDASSTKWYRISSTPVNVPAKINASFVLSTREGSRDQFSRFVICLSNRDPNMIPSFTLLSNHRFGTSGTISRIRLVADSGSGSNNSFHVEARIENDTGVGDAFIKIHDRSFEDNQSVVNFVVQADVPTSPARVVKEWEVSRLIFNANEAFTIDRNNDIRYGLVQGPIRKITSSTNLPFANAQWMGGFGSGDDTTQNGVFDPATVGSSVSDSDLNNFGMVKWINTSGDDGKRTVSNDVVNGDTLIDINQSGNNQFAFELVKTGWYQCTLMFALEGQSGNTNFSCRILRMNSSNVIQEAFGIFRVKNNELTMPSIEWQGFFNNGDQFICMKTGGAGSSSMQSSSHRFRIRYNGLVAP